MQTGLQMFKRPRPAIPDQEFAIKGETVCLQGRNLFDYLREVPVEPLA
jgi:hypothetical protein